MEQNYFFGVEIEVNSDDQRDFISTPLGQNEYPLGIERIKNAIASIGLEAEINPWKYNHNNTKWVCKPDSSCGIEICSPVFSRNDYSDLIKVLSLLEKDEKTKIDERCSLHVHIELKNSDMDFKNINNCFKLCSIIAWWVKCEHIFIDFARSDRKVNKYCKSIGLFDIFKENEIVNPFQAINKLADKYLTLNTYHFFNKRRNTIEFRLAEGTKDYFFVKNWIDLIFNFIDSSIEKSTPDSYIWLDPVEFFDFLNFQSDDLKKWFLERLIFNTSKNEFRKHAFDDYNKIFHCFLETNKKFIDVGEDKYIQKNYVKI